MGKWYHKLIINTFTALLPVFGSICICPVSADCLLCWAALLPVHFSCLRLVTWTCLFMHWEILDWLMELIATFEFVRVFKSQIKKKDVLHWTCFVVHASSVNFTKWVYKVIQVIRKTAFYSSNTSSILVIKPQYWGQQWLLWTRNVCFFCLIWFTFCVSLLCEISSVSEEHNFYSAVLLIFIVGLLVSYWIFFFSWCCSLAPLYLIAFDFKSRGARLQLVAVYSHINCSSFHY